VHRIGQQSAGLLTLSSPTVSSQLQLSVLQHMQEKEMSTSYFLCWAKGGKGQLVRRTIPCFCVHCVDRGCKDSWGCANVPYCGDWVAQEVKVKFRLTQ